MDLSGIIFVLLAIAWAVYLIPKALRHHDEVARTRAIDRFSDATRVLARREPVSDRDARLVVRPAAPRVSAAATTRSTTAAATAATPEARPAAPAPTAAGKRGRLFGRHRRRGARGARPVARDRRPATADQRPAARFAARRRRRILAFLLLCDVAVAAVAYLGRVPWWSVAVPAVLTVLFLVLCRTQVRRAPARPVAPRRPAEEPADEARPVDEPTPVAAEPVGECGEATFDDEEDTVGVPVAELRSALAAPGGSLWDPLPMTLPTYVTKPAARRTVRTIDLGEPGTWTSGRTEEDARIAARASEQAAPEHPGQRAVGS